MLALTPFPSPGGLNEEICHAVFMPVAAPSHALHQLGRELTYEDLKTHRQIVTRADMVFGTWLLDKEMPQWARDSGIFRSPNRSKQHKKSGRYGLPHCASTCNMLASREILSSRPA